MTTIICIIIFQSQAQYYQCFVNVSKACFTGKQFEFFKFDKYSSDLLYCVTPGYYSEILHFKFSEPITNYNHNFFAVHHPGTG